MSKKIFVLQNIKCGVALQVTLYLLLKKVLGTLSTKCKINNKKHLKPYF